ncbi:Splicing factor 3B subunit 4 [Nowakowskiella sp. JEL0407]|nr:Splicing factor 3B subunit 4 [Nowakowskiella sp. JEL0407]
MHMGYGFCEFMSEEDADYAIKIMNMVKVYGKPLRVNKATADKKNLEVGASLFLGNLDEAIDEKLLYDTFSAFGVIVQTPKIARDEAGNSKGYGFISFDNFESSDTAIESMNGQFLMNKPITVSYAFKKDGKGERHGSMAERILASEAKKNVLPNRLFADIQNPNALPVPVQAAPQAAPLPGMMPPPSFMPPPNMMPPPMGVVPNMFSGMPPAPIPGMPLPGMPPMGMPPNFAVPPSFVPPPQQPWS